MVVKVAAEKLALLFFQSPVPVCFKKPSAVTFDVLTESISFVACRNTEWEKRSRHFPELMDVSGENYGGSN